MTLYEKKEIGKIDAYESYIPRWSSLIGKTAQEVMEKYDDRIIIDHIHNSPIDLETKQKVSPDTVFKDTMSIKLFGDWQDICDFTKEYGLP